MTAECQPAHRRHDSRHARQREADALLLTHRYSLEGRRSYQKDIIFPEIKDLGKRLARTHGSHLP